jgi:uncharacterized protein YjbI with pentapeptide repeats
LATLSKATLIDANLTKADLVGAKLGGANLWGAALYGANLYGASMGEADPCGAILDKAKYDADTQWPEGFTPPPEAINVDMTTKKQGDPSVV